MVQNNRLMQPPQNGAIQQGQAIRQTTPQQQLQLPQQVPQGLRATPPRPAGLNSPTGAHFAGVGNPPVSLPAVVQMVQQQNPQLSLAEATKFAMENIARIQAQQLANSGTNGVMQQHMQQLAKSSPTQANQQIRRSPSQNPSTPLSQGQQRM